jgi:hypothetical protein
MVSNVDLRQKYKFIIDIQWSILNYFLSLCKITLDNHEKDNYHPAEFVPAPLFFGRHGAV